MRSPNGSTRWKRGCTRWQNCRTTRARTLSATKSLSSQLTQLQETTRSANEEVTGMAEIAAGRIDATAQSARQAMERTRLDLDAHASALTALVEASHAGVASSSETIRAALTQDLDEIDADLRQRLSGALQHVRATMAATDEGLGRRAETLESLMSAAQAGINNTSEAMLAVLARDMGRIETDLRERLNATLERAQQTLASTDLTSPASRIRSTR